MVLTPKFGVNEKVAVQVGPDEFVLGVVKAVSFTDGRNDVNSAQSVPPQYSYFVKVAGTNSEIHVKELWISIWEEQFQD